MSTKSSGSMLWWVVFAVTTILFLAFVIMGTPYNKWFWVWIPFMGTGFVKGMNWI